jgi:hypothetical protein
MFPQKQSKFIQHSQTFVASTNYLCREKIKEAGGVVSLIA